MRFGLSLIVALAAMTQAAQAVPTTWIFTGKIDTDLLVDSQGLNVQETFAAGQSFTLTYSFDSDLAPESVVGGMGTWTSNATSISTITLNIGGFSYSVGAPSPQLVRDRVAGPNSLFEREIDAIASLGGSATTTGGYNDVAIIFRLEGPAIGPAWPSTIDLSDWDSYVHLAATRQDNCGVDCVDNSGSFFTVYTQAFETLQIITEQGAPVPAPFAAGLLGLGLLGLGALRRKLS